MNGLTNVEEKVLSGHRNGAFVLILTIFLYILSVFGFMIGIAGAVDSDSFAFVLLTVVCVLWFLFGWILFLGLKVLKPNEALVLTLFGKYTGTIKGDGFFFVNPLSRLLYQIPDTLCTDGLPAGLIDDISSYPVW